MVVTWLPSWHFLQRVELPVLLSPCRMGLLFLSGTHSTEGLEKEAKTEEQASQLFHFVKQFCQRLNREELAAIGKCGGSLPVRGHPLILCLLQLSGFAGWDIDPSLHGLFLMSMLPWLLTSPVPVPHSSMEEAGTGQSQRVAAGSLVQRGVRLWQLPSEVLGLTGQMKPFVPANGPFLAVMELARCPACSSSAAMAITRKWFYWSAESLSPVRVPLLLAPPSPQDWTAKYSVASLTWKGFFLRGVWGFWS